MPNDVFLRTRAGLSSMISDRAAERILEGALKGRGHTPDDVDCRQMRSALLGPVLRELEGVVPSSGLKRNLERLARRLVTPRSAAPASSAVLPPPSVPPSSAVLQPSSAENTGEQEEIPSTPEYSAEPDSELPTELPTDILPGAETGAEPGPELPTDIPPGAETGAQPNLELPTELPSELPTMLPTVTTSAPASVPPTKAAAQPPARTLSQGELERFVSVFAQIEHVQLVAAIRKDGSIAVTRGAGPDLAMLSHFSRLALTLLARGGQLRSLHLGHTSGELFLFPIGLDLLVVFGNVDLNLGAVTTAFTALALEEDL